MIIGAYGFDHFRGAAFLFCGSKTGGLSPTPLWRGEGEAKDDWYGYSVSSAGDVNHDGLTDILIGAKKAASGIHNRVGKAYAYQSSQAGLPRRPSWSAQGENAEDFFGWRALKAGDVNGDGFDDAVVAAYSHSSPGRPQSGKVYVYLGGPRGLAPSPAWTQEGERGGALFGTSIASGDFNHDGYSDILVGSPHFPAQGKVYLYLGGPRGLALLPSDIALGEKADDHFGAYVANAGDVNGDGYPDILVGAPDNSEKGVKAGKVYLFYGGKNGKLNRIP